ncbi:MAG: autotransporter domain-containing protein, partial [Bradyrhizobium sp.]
PDTSLYTAIPSMALIYGRGIMDTLHERVGEEEHLRNRDRLDDDTAGFWGRAIGQFGRQDGDSKGVYDEGPKFDYSMGAIQIGKDLYRGEDEDDIKDSARDHAGVYGAAGLIGGDVTHFDGNNAGSDLIGIYSLGAYWTHFGSSGWYLDGVFQASWYDVNGDSLSQHNLNTAGWGIAASLEGGYPIKLGDGYQIEPQAQVVYQTIQIYDANDGVSEVSFGNIQSLTGRVGVRLSRDWQLEDTAKPRQLTAWIRPSVWEEFLGTPHTRISSPTGPVPFSSDIDGTFLQLNAGVSAEVTHAMSLFANVGYDTALDDNNSYDVNGKVGVRFTW